MTPQTVLIAVTLFQIKHLIADFILQSGRMVTEKGHYGRLGGLQHAGLHVVFTAPILLWVGVAPLAALAILLAEFVIHYHIDWLKASHARRTKLTPASKLFWITLGIDQAMHQLTYVGILAAILWLAV